MIVKMKFINISGPRDDIDRVPYLNEIASMGTHKGLAKTRGGVSRPSRKQCT